MFGEYGLYLDGKIFGLVCDDHLFIKTTPAGLAYAGELCERAPFPGAKPRFFVSGERWDEADWLAELVRRTVAALPAPAPKKPKGRKGGAA